jgi:hypothetical protein
MNSALAGSFNRLAAFTDHLTVNQGKWAGSFFASRKIATFPGVDEYRGISRTARRRNNCGVRQPSPRFKFDVGDGPSGFFPDRRLPCRMRKVYGRQEELPFFSEPDARAFAVFFDEDHARGFAI